MSDDLFSLMIFCAVKKMRFSHETVLSSDRQRVNLLKPKIEEKMEGIQFFVVDESSGANHATLAVT